MQTVQYNFGIRVNDYVMVNFNSFISLIDRIGGIDVYVEQEIYDAEYPDMFYGYDPFYMAAGLQHLDGATALKYAAAVTAPMILTGVGVSSRSSWQPVKKLFPPICWIIY